MFWTLAYLLPHLFLIRTSCHESKLNPFFKCTWATELGTCHCQPDTSMYIYVIFYVVNTKPSHDTHTSAIPRSLPEEILAVQNYLLI